MTLMPADSLSGRFRATLRAGRTFALASSLLLTGVALFSVAYAPVSLGQARINANSLAAETMGPEDKQGVDAFVSEQTSQLLSDEPKEVSRARASFVDVYGRWNTGGGSQAFADYYNKQVAGALTAVLKPASSVLARVNASLLASRVLSPAVVPVFEAGLADDNEGVRFQTATSVGLLADRDAKQDPASRLQETFWNDLLKVCGQRLKIETSPLVVQRVLVAMGKLPISAAAVQVLDAIDGRVVLHVDNSQQPMIAELEALKQVVLYINSQPEEARPELFKRAIGVSMKLSKVAVAQLQKPMPEDLKDQRVDMIKYVEAYVLRDPTENAFAVALNKIPGEQDQIGADLRAGKFAEVQQALEAWEQFLLAAPVQIDPALMRVPR